MNFGNEQIFAINVCFNAIVSATETTQFVKKAYGFDDLNRLTYLGVIWVVFFISREKGPGRR